MLDKLVPQLRAQVRPNLPGKAGARDAHERAPACAPLRRARRERVGEVLAAAVEAVFEGAREGRRQSERGDGRVTDRVAGQGRGQSGGVGVAGESGTPGGGVAHRGRLLKMDLDASASGDFDGVLGLGTDLIPSKAVSEGGGWDMVRE